MVTTVTGLVIASSYTRVVRSERGAYVEFTQDAVDRRYLVPPDAKRQAVERDCADDIFYHELRTQRDNVKVYDQLKYVGYADYNPGMLYVDINDVIRFKATEVPLTVERCRQHPDVIYLFGDNLERWGTKGQAVIRDEPNAVGVPTKKAPRRDPDAYMTDEEWGPNIKAINNALLGLPVGRLVMVPVDIGTGLSKLDVLAPRTYAYLRTRLGLLASTSTPNNG